MIKPPASKAPKTIRMSLEALNSYFRTVAFPLFFKGGSFLGFWGILIGKEKRYLLVWKCRIVEKSEIPFWESLVKGFGKSGYFG